MPRVSYLFHGRRPGCGPYCKMWTLLQNYITNYKRRYNEDDHFILNASIVTKYTSDENHDNNFSKI